MSEIDEVEDRLFLQCECAHPDHLVEFSIEDWFDPSGLRSKECKLIVRPMLTSRVSFLQRVFIAFRYIFGLRSTPSYHFDTCMISDERDLQELEKLSRRVRTLIKVRKAIEAKNAK